MYQRHEQSCHKLEENDATKQKNTKVTTAKL